METRQKHEMLVCPYDEFHMVEAYRYQRHLRKCGLVHKDMKMGQCSFDATHIVPIHELQYHHSKCPARYRVEKDLLDKPVVAPVQDEPLFISSECWDDDDSFTPVVRKLGGDGFKAVHPKNKPSQRPVADVEGWLAGQDNPSTDITTHDMNWIPPLDAVRHPRTMPKVMAGVSGHALPAKPDKMPQVFLSAIGRGQKLSVPSVPQSLIELGRGRGITSNTDRGLASNGDYFGSSSSSYASPRSIQSTSSGSSVGRGQVAGQGSLSDNARGERFRNCDSPMTSSASTTSDSSDLTDGLITRVDVTLPKGMHRIAAALGQPRPSVGQHDYNLLHQPADVNNEPNQIAMDERERKKLIRQLRKRLSEIQILKTQQEGGKLLDESQLTKIGKWDEYQQQLQKLEYRPM